MTTLFDLVMCLVCTTLFVGGFAALLIWAYLSRRNKVDGWKVFAERFGLVYDPKKRIVTGQYKGRALRLETFSSFNPFGADTDGTKMALSVKNPSAWKLTVETGAGAGRLGKVFGVPEVKVGVKALDEKFTFRSEPPELVSKLVLTPAIRQYLLTTRQYVKLTLEGNTVHESPLDTIDECDPLVSMADWLCVVAETLETAP